jgi:MbtH protein
MTTTNPFDDQNASFVILVNHEGRHSLWPTFADVPAGWTVGHGPASRRDCLDYVTKNWIDQRPLSLVAATTEGTDNEGLGRHGPSQPTHRTEECLGDHI